MKILNKKIFYLFIITFYSLSFISFAQDKKDFTLDINTRNYDQVNIKLKLNFDFDKEEVIGKEEFTFIPLVNDFNKLILHSKTTNVVGVTLNNDPLIFKEDNELLYIMLNKKLQKGDKSTVIINYNSFPSSGLFFFKPTKENPEIPYQVWSQGEGRENRYWYPAYDEPDDKLSSEIIATVPEKLIAISNGNLLSETHDIKSKTRTFDWKMDEIHANYLTTLIVGDFVTVKEKLRGTTLEYNLPRNWAESYDYFYGRTPQMLNFFSNYIFPYPYSRYAQTTVQDFLYGGMENVTATTLNRRLLHDKSSIPNYTADGLIAHEFAHQWFGDFLTCKTWPHVWLNEGFATYFTDLWVENEYGEDEFRFLRFNENLAYFDEVKNQPLDKIDPDSTGVIPVELSGGKAYDRGAAVLNTLRFYLGEDAFEKGIKHYVNKFQGSTVVTEDFRTAMEESTGKDLKGFFDQWIYGAGFPVYDVSYDWNKTTKKITLIVKQTQQELPAVHLFTVPVLVEVTAGKQAFQKKIWINKKDESFTFDCNENPQMVRFNKYLWTLCEVHFPKSFDEVVYQLQYDDDITGRIAAAKGLASVGKRATPYLERTVRRDNFFGVRLEAVESLRKIGGIEVYDALKEACKDFDGRVREAAVKSLSIFSPERVSKFLKDIFKNDENDYVKGAAAYSIALIRMPGAFEFLEKALKKDSHRNIIRRDIFEGLKKLNDHRAISLAKEYVKYKYSYGGMHLLDIVAMDCAVQFEKKHRKEVIGVLTEGLKNPYFRTRNHAAGLLAKLNAKDQLPLLKTIAKKERRNVVLRSLNAAIKSLEEKK
ncbi:MAG TPA: M1 family aminopeptidase [Ignavibacteriaceae bacterium]|nr:M1 family aminopeptidase [Ignavibacteriaceae bacterium]